MCAKKNGVGKDRGVQITDIDLWLWQLRYGSEVADGEDGDSDMSTVYWDPKHTPYSTWLKTEPKDGKPRERGQLSSLRWMQECTMGCQTTFESRRTELGRCFSSVKSRYFLGGADPSPFRPTLYRDSCRYRSRNDSR